jgi:hypothetical protein
VLAACGDDDSAPAEQGLDVIELCEDVVVDLIEGELDTTVGEFWLGDRDRLDEGLDQTTGWCVDWEDRHFVPLG